VDHFTLVVASQTDWAWDLDAVLAAIASTWPDAHIRDGYPLAGSSFRAFAYLLDTRAGREMAVALEESGQMISLEYGSPEASAASSPGCSTASYHPTTSPSNCSNGTQPIVTARTSVQDMLSIGD